MVSSRRTDSKWKRPKVNSRVSSSASALGSGAAEDGLDAHEEFLGDEGLRDVVVGAGLEALQDVLLEVLGREEDDGDVARRAGGPPPRG